MSLLKAIRVLFVAVILPVSAMAQDVDAVVKKYVAFIGGESSWKKIKTLVTSGEYDYGGIQFPFTAYAKSPDQYKFIVPFNGKYYEQGFDGKNGWKIDAFKNETKPTILTGKDARALANEADVELENVWVNYKAKGHRATLTGKDSASGFECYRIELVKSNGDKESWFFDVTTFQAVMKLSVSKNAELGGAMLQTVFSDYRKVGEIKIPFKSISTTNGQMILTVTVVKADVNVRIDEKEFRVKAVQ